MHKRLALPAFEKITDLFPPSRQYEVISTSGRVFKKQPKETFYVGIRTPTQCLPETGCTDARGLPIFYGNVLLYAPYQQFRNAGPDAKIFGAGPKLYLVQHKHGKVIACAADGEILLAPNFHTALKIGNAMQPAGELVRAAEINWDWFVSCWGYRAWEGLDWS